MPTTDAAVRAVAPPILPEGMRGARPALLLLDFDGVILDSVAIKTGAYLRIYADAPADARAAILAYQHAHGGVTRSLKFRHIERAIFGRSPTDDQIAALSAEYARLVRDAVLACPMLPGALAFLEKASPAAALHVVSGTPQPELEDIVARRGLSRYFAALHGAPATKPDAFRQVLAAEGVAAARTLAIGDGTTERDAAAALGIPFLGIVAAAEPNPFPDGVPVVGSLAGVAEALGFA